MTIRIKVSMITLILVFITVYLPVPVNASSNSLTLSAVTNLASALDPGHNNNGQPGVLRELVVNGLISLTIVQQPAGNNTFVSFQQNDVTEFQTASSFGAIGLLAHNYLAGQYFSKISAGQEIKLVYSDRRTKEFIVAEIQKYQALDSESPTSDFIDLATGKVLTASQVFKKTYGNRPGRLILQTCIYGEQNPSWGRLFIIAQPAGQAFIDE